MRLHDTGLTELALLAFLRAERTPQSTYTLPDPTVKESKISFADAVRGGLARLKDGQDATGCFPKKEGEGWMYDQAIALAGARKSDQGALC